jgi:hypothetical protein
MATRRKSRKSESRSTLGAIYDKAKEVVGDMLAGAGTGAVVGAADAAVKSAGGEIEADKKSEANKTSSNSAKKKLEKNGSPKEKKDDLEVEHKEHDE